MLLCLGFNISIFRIFRSITDRKAQLARFAFFTVPFTAGAAGWMGGVELGKIMLGRKNEYAWVAGAVVPAGIHSIWRRNIWKGVWYGTILAGIGYAYQYSCNNNLTNSFFFDKSNPNIPTPLNIIDRDLGFWNVSTREEYSTPNMTEAGIYMADPGPSWKKWEDKKSEE